MNWLAAIGVGLCSAPFTGLICGTAAGVCADWMNAPNRDGAAGFFAVAMSLFGAVLGLVVGIGFARGWFGVEAGFGRAFVLTLGSFTALALVVTGIARLTADLPPKIDGKELDLAIELRCPPGTQLVASEESYVTFVRLSNGTSAGRGVLDFAHARDVEGRTVIPATLSIKTSARRKLLHFHLNPETDLYFALGFGSKPTTKDFEWSSWIQAGHKLGEQKPSAATAFAMRYQVRPIEPPPPREQEEAAADARQEAEMRALAPDAPLAAWLVFTRYGQPQPRIDHAIAAIRARPNFAADMAHAMLKEEEQVGKDALRALEHMKPPPTELKDAVAEVGREIAQALRELPAAPSQEQEYTNGGTISSRFSAWIEAARALQGQDGTDFVPQLQEIIEPARKHPDSYVLKIDVVRVASFYLHKWGGIEPLPSDPPPR